MSTTAARMPRPNTASELLRSEASTSATSAGATPRHEPLRGLLTNHHKKPTLSSPANLRSIANAKWPRVLADVAILHGLDCPLLHSKAVTFE